MLRQHGFAVFTELLPTVHFYNGTSVSTSVVTEQATHTPIPFAAYATQNTANNSDPWPCH